MEGRCERGRTREDMRGRRREGLTHPSTKHKSISPQLAPSVSSDSVDIFLLTTLTRMQEGVNKVNENIITDAPRPHLSINLILKLPSYFIQMLNFGTAASKEWSPPLSSPVRHQSLPSCGLH
jgi:hypothetical protein